MKMNQTNGEQKLVKMVGKEGCQSLKEGFATLMCYRRF